MSGAGPRPPIAGAILICSCTHVIYSFQEKSFKSCSVKPEREFNVTAACKQPQGLRAILHRRRLITHTDMGSEVFFYGR
jgi:hypothetical protein